MYPGSISITVFRSLSPTHTPNPDVTNTNRKSLSPETEMIVSSRVFLPKSFWLRAFGHRLRNLVIPLPV
jgi:hypothetical protein